MASKLVNLRLNKNLLEKIDLIVKNSIYSNRTEFIKHVLIKTVEDVDATKLIKEMEDGAGLWKKQKRKPITSVEIEKARELSGKQFLKECGLG